ncbi:unnamed protein product, partial [marine sediment metagenome]
REHSEKYDGVIIPLSIATSFPTGTYGFVRALCSKHDHKYAIDPRTPLFQRDWDRKNVRPPHEKMAEIMGGPFKGKGLTSKLEPSDFSKKSTLNQITKNCLDFQMDFKARKEDVRKINKYKEMLGIKKLDNLDNPQFLIPPYFLFETPSDEWYKININCIQQAIEMNLDVPIQPILHFKNWPNSTNWQEILKSLTESNISSCWLYADNYKEHEQDLPSLKRYREAVKDTDSKGMKPFVLFGGYYAILMRYFGLLGFANGIGYGE